MPSYSELLIRGTEQLRGISESARLDAELLLMEAAAVSKVFLIAHARETCPSEAEKIFLGFITRRLAHEPVALIRGRKEFFGRDFVVNGNVLVPRPETELLVEQTILACEKRSERAGTICDLGTGSGCIAISILCELRQRNLGAYQVVAVDKSAKALAVASQNASLHEVGKELLLVQGDWLSGYQTQKPLFDIVVSNPPYIGEPLSKLGPELQYEPASALSSTQDGLSDILQLLNQVPSVLRPGGVFLCEIGHDHSEKLKELIPTLTHWCESDFLRDLADRERVLRCVRTSLTTMRYGTR